MRVPIRSQQEWAGARVSSGLCLGVTVAEASLAALWVDWGQLCVVHACNCFRVSNWVADLGSWHLASSLTLWPSESYLIHIIFFFASTKKVLLVCNSALGMVIIQVCKAKIICSENFRLKLFMSHISYNVRTTVWHIEESCFMGNTKL